MNKLAIIPLFFLSMCGTAPITDPPAHACSPRLDGKPTYCPDEKDLILVKPRPHIPREQARGEIDITSPYHLQSLQMMFMRNARRTQIEENATNPVDAINSALHNFWEQEHGSNGSTEQEKLL